MPQKFCHFIQCLQLYLRGEKIECPLSPLSVYSDLNSCTEHLHTNRVSTAQEVHDRYGTLQEEATLLAHHTIFYQKRIILTTSCRRRRISPLLCIFFSPCVSYPDVKQHLASMSQDCNQEVEPPMRHTEGKDRNKVLIF